MVAADAPVADEQHIATPANKGNFLLRTARSVIGYDSNEANRIGVPVVSSKDWLRDIFKNPGTQAYEYLDSLFPFTKWILSYNTSWAIGDLIAGFTVGLVVIPQSMSYAIIATVAPEYGLYSSFVGVMIYALFATSKDVTIGPVAVMSLQTANVIRHVQEKVGPGVYTNEVIATALAFICGVIVLGIGIVRLGWIVEFIPVPAVAGFMTGSALTIIFGQLPKLFGLSAVKTNGPAPYEVLISFFKNLPDTTNDAAFGLVGLAFLYFVRWLCNYLPRRYPGRPVLARACFFASVFRSAFVIIFLTLASWLYLRDFQPTKANPYPISILKKVPSGFQHVGQPNLDRQLISDLAADIPVSTIVLLLEHIAIAKSFGRLNNYKINPDQELIAMGVTNLVGPCFGAYAATGSFSRTAIKSKSGVRTPLAGWVTGLVVVVALYAVTPAFFWLPNAGLAAVIVHAVGDLIAPPSLCYRFWAVNPLELIIFFGAVFASIFATLEIGIYVSVGASLVLLLVRIARPRGRWLGTVTISHDDGQPTRGGDSHPRATADVFVPLDDKDGLRDPSILVSPPPPGVLIYRFEEAFTYPNASHLADLLIEKVKVETRPGAGGRYKKRGDRPWNDPGAPNPYLVKAFNTITRRKKNVALEEEQDLVDPRPLLRAFIFDFSSVSNVDTTSIQTLVDVRAGVERYADAQIEFHFANILSPWIRRALLAGGFGTGNASKYINEVAPAISQREGLSAAELERREQVERSRRQHAIERAIREGRQHQVYGAGVKGKPSKDIEAGASTLPATDEQQPATGDLYTPIEEEPAAILATHELRRQGTAGSSTSSGDVKGESSSSADEKLPAVADDEDEAGTRVASASSVASVPIVWGGDLTPFFHLTLNSALAAVSN